MEEACTKSYVLPLTQEMVLNNLQQKSATNQRRSFHTSRSRPYVRVAPSRSASIPHRRSLHLTTTQATDLLKNNGITISPDPSPTPSSSHFVGITVDRSSRSPCIVASPTTSPTQLAYRARRFPFDYRQGPSQATILAALEYLQLDAAPPSAKASAASLINSLWSLYQSKEALTLTVHLSPSTQQDSLILHNPSLTFDDAAFKSASRHPDIHSLRDLSAIPPAELEAEAHGIVYIPLPSPSAPAAQPATQTTPPSPPAATAPAPAPAPSPPPLLIGTLVNGAGLAMNTCDVLAARLRASPAANFLDTGGKATAATIAASFKLVLADPRVGVVFVNIFGGLTLCDMIARGVVLAFKEVGVDKPVVVMLRGTNEEEGARILRGAGLPIGAFDGFEEAVGELGRLVDGGAGRVRDGEVERRGGMGVV